MSSSLQSLIASGTKLWLDSVDPELVRTNREFGASGATSNPIIIADLLKSGRFDDQLNQLLVSGDLADEHVAWELTNQVVSDAEQVFLPVWEATGGDDGYVSFELDPLLEDASSPLSKAERTAAYVALGKKWAAGHPNRMIKVPATPAGIEALPPLAAAGVSLNVTLLFTATQYEAARNAVWQGAQQLPNLERFKSVYSIFVSRIDVYTEKHLPQLSSAAQGEVAIANAKSIWQQNQQFWSEHPTPLAQEIIFASTGTKKPEDKPWKYVAALAGSDIQTNPPATNDAVAKSNEILQKQIDEPIAANLRDEISQKVDFAHLEETLMREGTEKFATPQHALLKLIAAKRTR